jgi:signal transduction histidine kinase
MPNLISNLLKSNLEKIMNMWEKRAQTEILAAAQLESLALRDSLPEYLSQIVDALSNTIDRTPLRIANDKSASTRVGEEHGFDRATFSNFSVDQVIFEFHLLREIIFSVLEEGGALPTIARDVIISSIEQAVNDSATEFAAVLKEIQRSMLVTLTHDLGTPMAIARLSAELILDAPEDFTRNAKCAQKILQNIERVDRMHRELLDSSRVQSGHKMGLEFCQMDLTKSMKSVCEELTETFTDLIIFKGHDSITGYWSEQGLRRLLENLITNAVKYGSSLSSITVTLTQTDQVTKLEVHNFGKPIDALDFPTLFDQFTRGTDTLGKKGWGVGLSLVKGISDAHQGKIDLESSLEKGTTFTIFLPNDFRKAGFGYTA